MSLDEISFNQNNQQLLSSPSIQLNQQQSFHLKETILKHQKLNQEIDFVRQKYTKETKNDQTLSKNSKLRNIALKMNRLESNLVKKPQKVLKVKIRQTNEQKDDKIDHLFSNAQKVLTHLRNSNCNSVNLSEITNKVFIIHEKTKTIEQNSRKIQIQTKEKQQKIITYNENSQKIITQITQQYNFINSSKLDQQIKEKQIEHVKQQFSKRFLLM